MRNTFVIRSLFAGVDLMTPRYLHTAGYLIDRHKMHHVESGGGATTKAVSYCWTSLCLPGLGGGLSVVGQSIHQDQGRNNMTVACEIRRRSAVRICTQRVSVRAHCTNSAESEDAGKGSFFASAQVGGWFWSGRGRVMLQCILAPRIRMFLGGTVWLWHAPMACTYRPRPTAMQMHYAHMCNQKPGRRASFQHWPAAGWPL